MWLFVGMSMGMQAICGLEDGFGAGVTGGCELSRTSADKPTQVLWNSSTCFELLSYIHPLPSFFPLCPGLMYSRFGLFCAM